MNIKRITACFISCVLCGILSAEIKVVNAEEIQGQYNELIYTKLYNNNDGIYDSIEITSCEKDAISVEIPDFIDGLAVTSIGVGAFYSCDNILSVKISDSVTQIGENAFFRSPYLATLEFGNSVKDIGKAAFYQCESLVSIDLPDSVQAIGEGSFERCDGLSVVTISENVELIGTSAFSDCEKLTSISVSGNNKYYCDIDGVLHNKLKTELLCYPCNKIDTSYNVMSSVKTISMSAFYNCDKLENVILPASVENIERDAFSSCDNLNNITIKNKNCQIYNDRFTIYNGMNGDGYYFNGTIHGYANSTAQGYAEAYGYNFEAINESEEILGDANLDGILNVRDAAFIAQKLAKGLVSELPACADYTGDSDINVRDAAAIARYMANKFTS